MYPTTHEPQRKLCYIYIYFQILFHSNVFYADIVDSEKKKLKTFQLGSAPLSCETSNKLWKMIES